MTDLPKVIQLELTDIEVLLLLNAFSVASAMAVMRVDAALSAQRAFEGGLATAAFRGQNPMKLQNDLMKKIGDLAEAAIPTAKVITMTEDDTEPV